MSRLLPLPLLFFVFVSCSQPRTLIVREGKEESPIYSLNDSLVTNVECYNPYLKSEGSDCTLIEVLSTYCSDPFCFERKAGSLESYLINWKTKTIIIEQPSIRLRLQGETLEESFHHLAEAELPPFIIQQVRWHDKSVYVRFKDPFANTRAIHLAESTESWNLSSASVNEGDNGCTGIQYSYSKIGIPMKVTVAPINKPSSNPDECPSPL